MNQRKPKLNGVVLAGGKSVRMGSDKSTLAWHGQKQKYFVADMLGAVCDEVFISCRPDQGGDGNELYKTVIDAYTGIGPYGAILSAFKYDSSAAWLVVACDLPLLDLVTLQFLEANRDSNSMATAFQSPHDGKPEPLIAIWEPRSYNVLLSLLEKGYTCPRKVLMQSTNCRIIHPPDPEALMNVNTPDDFLQAEDLLKKKFIK